MGTNDATLLSAERVLLYSVQSIRVYALKYTKIRTIDYAMKIKAALCYGIEPLLYRGESTGSRGRLRRVCEYLHINTLLYLHNSVLL